MDGLVVLFIIWVVTKALKKAGNGGKKAATAAKKAKKLADVTGVSDAEKVIGEAVRKAKEYRTVSGTAPAQGKAADVPGPDISWLLEEEDCDGVTDAHGHSEGASHADDTGCVGGSLAHDAHEGLHSGGSLGGMKTEGLGKPGSLAAAHPEGIGKGGSLGAERTEGPGRPGSLAAAKAGAPGNLAARAKPDNTPIQGPAQKARFTAADMRRAVVTGEILGKPVALRGRTAGR